MGRKVKKQESDRNLRRLFSLGFIFPVLILCVLARSFWFQVLRREPWLALANNQYETREMLPARRGTLYDRDMNILAMDLPGSSLAVDPTQVVDKELLVRTLSEVLKGDEEYYRKVLFGQSNTEYVHLARAIQPQQRHLLESRSLRGLIYGQTLNRIRPTEQFASQVVGVTDVNREGAWGLELSLDRWIRGRDGWAIQQKDAFNRPHASLDYPVEKPVSGNNVVLTLNHVLQTVVEEELGKSVLRHKAKFGTAVLMDPFTGEVLAMASVVGHTSRTGDLDFNQRMSNRSVQWAFEPGSTFKVVTLAAALERGGYSPDSLIFCENGAYQVGSHVVNDHEESFGWLSLSRVIEESSNIGVAKVAQGLGDQVLYEYARNFGFGNKTGIQLPGESSGILRPLYDWNRFSSVFISFGQELSATSLQLAGMISVIANGGELVKPCIVRSILDNEGNIVKSFDRQIIRRVITRRTAAAVTSILERVVMRGSGNEAAVNGMRIAGKTGTAQKSVPGYRGYLPNTRVASFVGFWPAEAPRYALAVVLDEPTYQYWGSHSAAPLFGCIVNRIEGIPDTPQSRQLTVLKDGFTFASMEGGHSESIVLPEVIIPSKKVSMHHVPDLIGLSMRQATAQMSALGLEVQIVGHGRVIRQDPEAGTAVDEKPLCIIYGENIPGGQQ